MSARPRFAIVILIASVLITGAGHAAEAKPIVLFDEGHGQRFLARGTGPLDLSALAGVFEERGWTVRTSRTALSAEGLASVELVVISGAFAAPGAGEIDAVVRFLERGGRLCVMLHIGPPMDQLLYRLDVAIANGVIRERDSLIGGDPVNFRVTRFEPHPITRNLDGFGVYGGWALRNLSDRAGIIARTGPGAWIDLNGDGVLKPGDAVQSFGVVVAGILGQGRFAVFGDDAMFQNQFLKGGNLTLAANLVDWLAAPGGLRASGRPESPAIGDLSLCRARFPSPNRADGRATTPGRWW